ncbi:hypothetical protein Zmor_022089 [Zophobas morio]|uniref:Farnesyl pyrophosphate synthase n=2 Tax=Zophobas morio TaxID=2755281 RepID=A0AA38M063_9CUCU|nr:hypothetical protein Zmor_022089 [Zophobas morio]
MNRGLSVIHTYRLLFKERELTDHEIFKAYALGWCVELLQACFLVADDVMDDSVTRRGQPCWYRRPEVGLTAINDSFMLEMFIYKILNLYFRAEPFYIDLVELFLQITLKAEIGQLHDLITAPVDSPNFDVYTMERYKLIVKYKTSFYSFFLPVAEALIMAGKGTPKTLKTSEDILLVMGEFFQIQDDFLDCFGAPETVGKVGTDIEDSKCSWLVVQALLLANENQRKILYGNYGKKDKNSVDAVKALYKDLKLDELFYEYEERTYGELIRLIENTTADIPKEIFMDFANKIFKRKK